MKKYLAILTVLFTVILSSCSNDDVPVLRDCTIRVNPNTVISGFAEYDAGELTTIPNWCQLRVHLYLYDMEGVLKYSGIEYSSDYSHYISFKADVPQGTYRILTITDVMAKDGDPEYWSFSDEDNITRLKITKANYVAEQRGVLGYGTDVIEIGPDSEMFEIDAKPAGSLIFANVQNMKSIADVVHYDLTTNRRCESLQFTSSGEPRPSIESSNSMDWRTVILNVEDLSGNYNGLYTYYFSLPINNAKFEWHGINTSNKYYALGDTFTCSMGMGEEFDFELDAETLETYWGQVDLSRAISRSSYSDVFAAMNSMAVPLRK